MSQVLQVFLDSDLRAGHIGLSKKARQAGHSTDSLDPGQFLVFVNTKRNRMKVYAARQIIAYIQTPKGEHVDLRTIQHIPNVFRGGQVDYSKAIKEVVLSKLKPYPKEQLPLDRFLKKQKHPVESRV